MKKKHLFSNKTSLCDLVDSYFKHIEGEYHVEKKAAKKGAEIDFVDEKVFDRNPEEATIAGLAFYLGFNSREEFDEYETSGKYVSVIKRARLRIEAVYEQKLHHSSATGAMFVLKTISFQLGGYAQVNNLKYKTDDAVLPIGFADSIIKVADSTLPANADLFESQFAPTLNRPYTGGTVAQIKMVDGDNGGTDFSIGVSPRILIDQKLDIKQLGKTVTFTDGGGNDRLIDNKISTPYFYKPDAPAITGYGSLSLKFEDLRKKYYPELEKILLQTKKVIRYFLLTPRDILELDLLIPVYLEQDNAYYYINKIDAWRKGQPTKVELVKLG